jgi:tRNA(fMet)-specific endonuclease VapC
VKRLYLLDTDISVYLLNGRFPHIAARLAELPGDRIGTTAITAAELRFGALHSGRPQQNLARVETFIAPLVQVPFDENAAIHYSQIKQFLSAQGKLIGTMDMLIASAVLAAGGILVTNNVDEFSRVPSLAFENWPPCNFTSGRPDPCSP